MTSENKQYRLPMAVEEGTILPTNAKPEDFKIWTINGKKCKVYLVPVSKEVYQEIVNEEERNKKKRLRHMDRAATHGDCYADPLSLGDVDEEPESEFSAMQMDLVTLRLLFEELVCKIEKQYPQYGQILRLTREGKTQREIAKILGKCQATIKEQQQAALKILRELYNKEV